MSIFLGEGDGKKNEQVTLIEVLIGAFKILKKACLKAPVLAFADLAGHFS